MTPKISKPTPSTPKPPSKPKAETFMPAGCKKEDDKSRYCDTSFLMKERELKKKKEEQEEAKRKEEKAQCGKVINFEPETRNKWMPVTIKRKGFA